MKKIAINVYIWFIQKLMALAHILRIYPGWAKTYRLMHHKKYEDVELQTGLTPIEAQEQMNKLTWTKDGFREAWDSVGSPHWVQHCLNEIDAGREQPEGALDCDDFTSWAVNVIDPKFDPLFFGQGWAKVENGRKTGKLIGHAVCVIKSPANGKLLHVGNWGRRGPFANLTEVGEDVAGSKRGTGHPVAWCVYTKDLKLVAKGDDLPPETVGEDD